MLIRSLLLALTMLAQTLLAATPIPIPNASFEQGQEHWTISEPEPRMTRLATRAASVGGSLHITDDSSTAGSSAYSAHLPLPGEGRYNLSLKAMPVRGSGLGIYVQLFDAGGNRLPAERQQMAPSRADGKWHTMEFPFYATDEAATARIWLHSYSGAIVEAYVDDFTLTHQPFDRNPPWPPQYKIRPDEQHRLTPADVVGPDGIVYPDWRHAGIPGGIPAVAGVRFEEFGAIPDDDKDDAAAIQRAIDVLAATGRGGAILLGEGTYHLDRPILIASDGIVLRGQGADKTRLIFRYAIPQKTVRFHSIEDGATLNRASRIEAHADPEGLQTLAIYAGDRRVASASRAEHWGNTFSIRASIWTVREGDGAQRRLRAVATYADGTEAEHVIQINLDPARWNDAPPPRVPAWPAAISFAGRTDHGPQLKLARDGARGDMTLTLEDASTVAAGDRIRLRAPATARWKALTQNLCPWGEYRRYDLLVTAVDGNVITLNQPLRIEYPTIDGSYIQKIHPIRHCGIEDLYLEQTENLWITGILFSDAWECWARGVTVKKGGRMPLYTLDAKWCEIRDSVFDDAHFKGGGGTAYVGFERTCDSLMENVVTHQMRHAPLVQWSAAGNVIRNSRFEGSDGQWHSGWTNENLFENCIINSGNANGAYGYGLWGSPPEDTAHGPNGPRNVVYNCDVSSPRAGLWMGGMNENWLILYNRFIVGQGPGVYARTASFDHIIRGNHFVLKDANAPAIELVTPDCSGVEVIDNAITGGNGKLLAGTAHLAADRDNRLLPAGDLPRPTPAVPSIFQWQREQGR